ncbi:hypothetical protein [Candidatus Terasakiella magnetica]|uniref:hypothetical protein n=1 Tax=Candidatus Terasakiella magnetica TaxID=1867952 RepID=UPI000840EFEF|nr:hypothetical protein [Candidatus Terasakiella magnetica]
MSGSAQVSPRILSAFERLDTAINQLQKACDSQKDKVDVSEVDKLHSQVEGLQQDNLALSVALEAHAEADYDTQFDQLNEKLGDLEGMNALLEEKNSSLKEMNSDFSTRLEKLIGNVEQVLQEEE